jgi:hypothetical protein
MTATESETQINKVPAPKEKLQSVMEAASALTALCDEDSANGEGAPSSPKITPKKEETPDTTTVEAAGTPKDDGSKRFLPDHKKPDAALTFPEKVSYILCCGWSTPSETASFPCLSVKPNRDLSGVRFG